MPAEPLDRVLARVRDRLLDTDSLVRAVLSGRRKGRPRPEVGGREVRRVELRPVDLRGGRHLQVTAYDEAQAMVANHADEAAAAVVDALLVEPFGNLHLETTTATLQVRITKRGEALAHETAREQPIEADRGHDRDKRRLLAEDDPAMVALGISTEAGGVKPSRQAKYRQVEEFLRLLDTGIADALGQGRLRQPTPEEPLRITDLGCGNAYLTIAAHRYLAGVRGLPVRLTGIDVKQQATDHNEALADQLGLDAEFAVARIAEHTPSATPEVVLALHACDTATDDALARAVEWGAGLVLAAPCCHHDVAAQLRRLPTPAPYSMLTRHGILRERFADTLTDALRASLLRAAGYRVEVVQFVESRHTPRNTLIRAVRTGEREPAAREEYDELVAAWGVRPRLAELLGVATARG